MTAISHSPYVNPLYSFGLILINVKFYYWNIHGVGIIFWLFLQITLSVIQKYRDILAWVPMSRFTETAMLVREVNREKSINQI